MPYNQLLGSMTNMAQLRIEISGFPYTTDPDMAGAISLIIDPLRYRQICIEVLRISITARNFKLLPFAILEHIDLCPIPLQRLAPKTEILIKQFVGLAQTSGALELFSFQQEGYTVEEEPLLVREFEVIMPQLGSTYLGTGWPHPKPGNSDRNAFLTQDQLDTAGFEALDRRLIADINPPIPEILADQLDENSVRGNLPPPSSMFYPGADAPQVQLETYQQELRNLNKQGEGIYFEFPYHLLLASEDDLDTVADQLGTLRIGPDAGYDVEIKPGDLGPGALDPAAQQRRAKSYTVLAEVALARIYLLYHKLDEVDWKESGETKTPNGKWRWTGEKAIGCIRRLRRPRRRRQI